MNERHLGFAEFIKLVLEALEAASVEYLIGGAVASWAWGEPRATMDLDLIVEIPLESIGQLSRELEKRDMVVPEEIILNAILEERSDIPIHAIHIYSGFKANLYPLRPGDELCQTAFLRRKQIDLGPQIGQVYLHSPEDLVVYKLCYYSLSWQTKHLRDISAILHTLGDDVDLEYIEYWADRKGVIGLWRELFQRFRATYQG